MNASDVKARLEQILSDNHGILRLEPAWVARDWLSPGRRLGLDDAAYDVGDRGFICERWLGSTTHADNRVGPSDEGMSYLAVEGEPLLLKDAVDSDPSAIMGADYAGEHTGLGRLAKIFDYAARIPFHIHPGVSTPPLWGEIRRKKRTISPRELSSGYIRRPSSEFTRGSPKHVTMTFSFHTSSIGTAI